MAGDHYVVVHDDKLSYRVKTVIGHEIGGDYRQGIDNRRAEEEDLAHDLPYLVKVTEVNKEGGHEQPGSENKKEEDNVNQGEQEHGDGQISQQDEYYGQQDYELKQGAYEGGQGIAQDQYLPGYIDSGHQAGLADDSAEGRGSAVGEEPPGHYAHHQIYGEILLATEDVSEDKVQDQCQQKWAEQRPEKAKEGILVAIFQVDYGQVPD